jgi:hypothetical protein
MNMAAFEAPLGPEGGPYSDDPFAALMIHVNRETMHHGGETGVLRDLYRDRPEEPLGMNPSPAVPFGA